MAYLGRIQAERREFLLGLSDSQFEQEFDYRSMAGDPFRNRLADLVRHVVNHSTYHRGQAATQLRQLGAAPPSTDLTVYLRKRV